VFYGNCHAKVSWLRHDGDFLRNGPVPGYRLLDSSIFLPFMIFLFLLPPYSDDAGAFQLTDGSFVMSLPSLSLPDNGCLFSVGTGPLTPKPIRKFSVRSSPGVYHFIFEEHLLVVLVVEGTAVQPPKVAFTSRLCSGFLDKVLSPR